MSVRSGMINIKYPILFFIITFLSANIIFAQGEIDDSQKILIRNESTFGFSLNTNGFGGNYRYGNRTSGFKKNLFEVDFNYIKHTKEIKTSSYFYNNKSYVYGKMNSFYTFHLAYGRQNEIFSKFDKGGIAISYYFLVGTSIGILKPKLYEVTYEVGVTEIEDFATFYHKTKNYHTGFIMGNAPYFEGFKDTKIKPGIFVTAGTNFEFSKKDKYITAMEAGITLDLFTDDIPIMFTEDNNHNQAFVTLFIIYRIGKIIDGRAKYKERKKLKNRISEEE